MVPKEGMFLLRPVQTVSDDYLQVLQKEMDMRLMLYVPHPAAQSTPVRPRPRPVKRKKAPLYVNDSTDSPVPSSNPTPPPSTQPSWSDNVPSSNLNPPPSSQPRFGGSQGGKRKRGCLPSSPTAQRQGLGKRSRLRSRAPSPDDSNDSNDCEGDKRMVGNEYDWDEAPDIEVIYDPEPGEMPYTMRDTLANRMLWQRHDLTTGIPNRPLRRQKTPPGYVRPGDNGHRYSGEIP